LRLSFARIDGKKMQNKPSEMLRSERLWVRLGRFGRRMVLPLAGAGFHLAALPALPEGAFVAGSIGR
jgi:hypothetical protein